MAFAFLRVVALAALLAPVAAVETANPLAKVIELLDSLAAKIKKEGEVEAKAYKEFMEWCDDASTNTGFEIKTATTKIEELKASISKSESESSTASSKIEDLAASISASEADLTSCIAIREKEGAEFKANEAELMDAIDTLSRAIAIIERQMAKNPGAFAQVPTANLNNLVQTISAIVDAASFSSADKQKLTALVQQQQQDSSDDEIMGAPAAAVYKSKSGNIVDVLEDLKEKAEEQLAALRKAESNAAHNYAMLHQSLEDQIAFDTKQMTEQKKTQAASEEFKATCIGDLSVTQKELSNAEASLETTKSSCLTAAADNEASVAARAEELKVIAEAKKTLSETTSGAVAQTYSLLQLFGTSQTGSSLKTSNDLARAEVVTLLKRLAKQHHSAALAQLASRIAATLRFGASAGEDPFAKVKELISGMIAKLESEAGQDATEKAYCDEQLAKTEEKKGELDFTISKLTTKIDKAVAASAELKEEVKTLQAELATLAEEQAAADKQRRESHANFVEAKADLEQGLAGVRQALGTLRQYYGGAASAAAMIQGSQDLGALMQQPDEPGTHSKASGAGSSIIGLLEVVESDFAKNLAAEETAEEDAEAAYQKLSMENKVTKQMKEQDVKYKTQEFKGLDQSITELTADREGAATELSAVLEYYSKIKERCIAKPMTYDQRKQRREAEIAGLKEALTILENEAALVQKGTHGRKGARGQAFLGVSR